MTIRLVKFKAIKNSKKKFFQQWSNKYIYMVELFQY